MNRILLSGRLTRNPQLRSTTNGTSVCSFSLAVDRKFRDINGEKETDFFDVIAWKKLGESCGKYLAKGQKVIVSGAIQTRSYEKDGVKRKLYEVIADDVEFPSKSETGVKSQSQRPAIEQGFTPVEDDELPF